MKFDKKHFMKYRFIPTSSYFLSLALSLFTVWFFSTLSSSKKLIGVNLEIGVSGMLIIINILLWGVTLVLTSDSNARETRALIRKEII